MRKRLYLVFAAVVMALTTALFLPAASTFAACGTVNKPLPGFRSWSAGLPCSGSGSSEVIEWNAAKSEGAVASEMNKFIWTIVLNIVATVSALVGYICIGMIIYAGFLYMSAGGNSGQLEKAKKTIMRTVIGLVICVLANTIVQIVINAMTGVAP